MRNILKTFKPQRLPEKLELQIEQIEDTYVDLIAERRVALSVCGVQDKWDAKHKVKIPSIWKVNRGYNARVDVLDEEYQQLTEMVYGRAYSLKGEEEKTEAYSVAAKFAGK
tara:strand:+ start:143 stop:475 length:333 start_codon:yes stop_codon:yes gene_type:complete